MTGLQLLLILGYFVVCIAASTAPGGDGLDLVMTPHGYRPAKCIHRAKEYEAVLTPYDDYTEVFYPLSGKRERVARDEDCVSDAQRLLRERAESKKQHGVTAWIDYASYSVPSMGNFTSIYEIPSKSPPNGGQLLYFFIGLENLGGGAVAIEQPVVNFCGESKEDYCGGQYGQGWGMEPWNCCPNGQTWTGKTIMIKEGDSTPNWIYANTQRVEIGMQLTGGQPSKLTIANNGRTWNWACATLEQYGVKKCSDYNSSPFNCTQMKLISLSGQNIDPKWRLTGNSQCNGGVIVMDDYNVAIYGTGKPRS